MKFPYLLAALYLIAGSGAVLGVLTASLITCLLGRIRKAADSRIRLDDGRYMTQSSIFAAGPMLAAAGTTIQLNRFNAADLDADEVVI